MMNFSGGEVSWMMVVGPLVMLIGLVTVLFIARGLFYGGTSRSLRNHGDQRVRPETFVKKQDPLELVRERYARGEISHEELEQYLSNLLQSERPEHFGDNIPPK